MEAGVIAAIISVSGAIALAIANSFVAERYRRFHDGSALAAALAGELGSYETAWPLIRSMLTNIVVAIDAGQKEKLVLRSFERPRDRVFEESIGKLGLLGSSVVESVVYVYGNIGGFRIALEIIAKDHASMTSDELRYRCQAALEALDRAVSRGEPLLQVLRERATRRFLQPSRRV